MSNEQVSEDKVGEAAPFDIPSGVLEAYEEDYKRRGKINHEKDTVELFYYPTPCYYLSGGKKIPTETSVGNSIRILLDHIGEDPDREGLLETPNRVMKALFEMTEGYKEDPKLILQKTFKEEYDELIVVKGIPFTSLCEHHLQAFVGTVDIGYLPNRKVVGLSKLPRLVDCFAKRLQIQERMTKEIAEAISTHLQPKGVGVVVKASHNCLACRGIKKSGVTMITSSMLDAFRREKALRNEFLELCK